jgi:hypothetical protein
MVFNYFLRNWKSRAPELQKIVNILAILVKKFNLKLISRDFTNYFAPLFVTFTDTSSVGS